MELPQDIFESILGSLNARGVNPEDTECERRAYPRIPLSTLAATIQRQGQTRQCLEVLIRDVSLGGIGIVVKQRMDRGEEFVINLPLDGGSISLLCRVRYCAQLSGETVNGEFGIGARFVEVAKENPPQLQSSSSN